MADITMCQDQLCNRRFSCHRFTAPTDWIYQTVFARTPRNGDHCEYFWDNEGWSLDKKFRHHERIQDNTPEDQNPGHQG